jgi:hypothetical protein
MSMMFFKEILSDIIKVLGCQLLFVNYNSIYALSVLNAELRWIVSEVSEGCGIKNLYR